MATRGVGGGDAGGDPRTGDQGGASICGGAFGRL